MCCSNREALGHQRRSARLNCWRARHIYRCPVSPHVELWPFLGTLIFSMFLLHNEFWPFLVSPSLAFDLPQCQEPWRWERRRRGGIAGNEEQKKQRKQHIEENQDKQKYNNKERGLATFSQKHDLCPFGYSGVQVFWCVGVQLFWCFGVLVFWCLGVLFG